MLLNIVTIVILVLFKSRDTVQRNSKALRINTRPDVYEEIFNHQYNGEYPFLFGDKVPLHTRLFNRYNAYYTNNVLPKEAEWVITKCPDGQFVAGIGVTNPISSYYNNRRIYKIVFTCKSQLTGASSVLDLYDRFTQGGHNLTIGPTSKLNEKRTCEGGFYNGMTLIYHVQGCRRFLVEAWALELTCSNKQVVHNVIHGYAIDNWPPAPKDSHANAACVSCPKNKAICGFETAITHVSRGTIEGLYFKVICCKAPITLTRG